MGMTGYDLSKAWWDFVWDNEHRIKPNHTALFFFIVEINNRLGWKEQFGITAKECMSGMGISKWQTYKQTLADLIDFGFVQLVQESKNQYQCNIIAIDKKSIARVIAKAKQGQSQGRTTDNRKGDIHKTIKTVKTINIPFADFWNVYANKKDKAKAEKAWIKLSDHDREMAMKNVHRYQNDLSDPKYQKYAATWLNNRCWEDYEDTNCHSVPSSLDPEEIFRMREAAKEERNKTLQLRIV